MDGPKQGEEWQVGAYTELVLMGIGKDFAQEKFFIFEDKGWGGKGFFIISKDDFYDPELKKKKVK